MFEWFKKVTNPSKEDYKSTKEHLRKHYKLEKELAKKILESDPDNRNRVMKNAYRKLYEEIEWHSEDKKNTDLKRKKSLYQKIKPFLPESGKIIDLGCGAGGLCQILSEKGYEVTGVDIILEDNLIDSPRDFKYLKKDITNELAEVEYEFDIAISNQVIEHLHPNDVPDHIATVAKILKKDGKFIIRTPSNLGYPSDVSKYFDRNPKGFHLKEYSYSEIEYLLLQNGFRQALVPLYNTLLKLKTPNILIPINYFKILNEKLKNIQDLSLQTALSLFFGVKGIFVIAIK